MEDSENTHLEDTTVRSVCHQVIVMHRSDGNLKEKGMIPSGKLLSGYGNNMDQNCVLRPMKFSGK